MAVETNGWVIAVTPQQYQQFIARKRAGLARAQQDVVQALGESSATTTTAP